MKIKGIYLNIFFGILVSLNTHARGFYRQKHTVFDAAIFLFVLSVIFFLRFRDKSVERSLIRKGSFKLLKPAHFDHMYFILSAQAYDDFLKFSEFHKLFGSVSSETVDTGSGEKWEGTYFRFVHSYLEILKESDKFKSHQTGLAFSAEYTTDSKNFYHYQKTLKFKKYTEGSRTLKLSSSETIPWFKYFSKTSPQFYFWTMIYEKQYLEEKGAVVSENSFNRQKFREELARSSQFVDETGIVTQDITITADSHHKRQFKKIFKDLTGLYFDRNSSVASANGTKINLVSGKELRVSAVTFRILKKSEIVESFDRTFDNLRLKYDGKEFLKISYEDKIQSHSVKNDATK